MQMTKPRESGSALMVAMVMIFMLSIMSVSVMRSSTLEKRMTINAIQTATTFTVAESATDEVLNDETNLKHAQALGMNKELVVKTSGNEADRGIRSAARLYYVGIAPAEGFSFGEGTATFQAFRYRVRGISEIKASGAQRSIEQGAYQVVPGG